MKVERLLQGFLTAAMVITLAGTDLSVGAQSFSAERSGGISGSLVVDAQPEEVFQAIKKSRSSEPHRRKVVSVNGNTVILHEKFARLPVIGEASCTYRETEIPHRRIDFEIVDSRHFKTFEGAWKVVPLQEGKTRVTLTSRIDTYADVPFKRQILGSSTKRDIKRRLKSIKRQLDGR